MNEIRVPVKLEVLQNSISDLQKILNNLQPNTASFKAIEKIINSMVNESQKLQAQLSKPFTNEGQFKSTNKTIDKLEESAARIQVVMNGLKFSDLKLTPDQQSSFDELNNKIIQVKSNYEDFLNKLKTGVVTNGNNRSLIEALPGKDMLDANFSDISSAVDKYVSELQTKVKQAEDALNKLQSNVELARRSEILTTTGKGINKESLGEALFNKYFWQNGAGEIGFKLTGKGSGSAAFLAELEQMFHLDPGQLKDLAGKSFADINKAFQEMGQKGHLNPFEGIQKAWSKKSGQVEMDKTALADLKKDLEEYRRLQIELQTLQTTQVGPKDSATQAEVSRLEQELGKLEQRIYSTAAAGGTMRAPLDQLGSQFDYLRNQLAQTNTQFLRMQRVQQSFNQMKMAVVNFMGFNQVLNLTKRAVKEAVNHIKELDTVMNKISIVTDMNTGDLWGQVDQYSRMAQAFGTTIKGAYEVSQIYYQQGLGTNDVLTLTNETLKLAKVSGLDYATTTDYMTTALRGFKMEMSEASTVVDVYSNLAAHTAVSSEELAVAMSKTASSMESVGSTFEETSAMIGTMVAVTRESAVNIGSALKSIAARYGEMKKDPLSIIDSEGEEVSFNKVDAALQSVGISLKTTDGQFRDFTDVILELSEKWDQLESTQQRYIATQFAGNRQQSRFLALVSNKDLLKANIGFAEESEDTGTLQALKALDSIESKLNQVQVAYQQFYTTMGIEDVWKGFLDGAKNVINTLNSLPKLFGKLPIAALGPIMSVVSLIKTIGTNVLTGFASVLVNSLGTAVQTSVAKAGEGGKQVGDSWIDNLIAKILGRQGEVQQAMQQATQTPTTTQAGMKVSTGHINQYKEIQQWEKDGIETATITAKYDALYSAMAQEGEISDTITQQVIANQIKKQEAIRRTIEAYQQQTQAAAQEENVSTGLINRFRNFATAHTNLANSMQQFGSALSVIGMVFNTATEGGRKAASAFQFAAGGVSLFSAALKIADKTTKTIPWMAIATGILAIVNGISLAIETPEEKLERLTQTAEELNNKAKEAKANYRTLETSKTKLDELEKKRYDSAESAEEYQSAVDDLASKFPELISRFDEAGNAIIETENVENALAEARKKTAAATYEAAQAEKEKAEHELKVKTTEAAETAKKAGNYNKDIQSEIYSNARKNIISSLETFESDKNSGLYKAFKNTIGEITFKDYVKSEDSPAVILETVLSDLYDSYTNAGPIHEGMGEAQAKQIDNILNSMIRNGRVQGNNVDLQGLYNDLLAMPQSVEVVNLISLLEQLPEINSHLNEIFNSNDLEQLFNLIVNDLNEGNIFDAEEHYGNLKQLIDQYKSEGIFTEYVEGFEKSFNDLGLKLKDLKQYAQKDQNSAKLLITSYIANQNAEAKFVQDESGLSGFIANKYTKIWHEEAKDLSWDKFLNEYSAPLTEIATEAETFWQELSLQGPEAINQFKQVLNNSDIYSLTDLENLFGYLDNWNLIENLLQEDYDTRYDNIQESLSKKQESIITTLDKEKKQYNKFDIDDWRESALIADTTSQARVYTTVLNQYSNLISDGYVESAHDYMGYALEFIDGLTSLGTQYRTTVESYLNQYNINTKAGIQSVIDKIAKDDITENDNLIPLLEKLLLTTNDNISLAFQTAISDFTEAWEKKAKTLDKLTKGLDISDVASVINEASAIGFTLNTDDFVMSGDKLVLQADKAAEYYKAVYEAEKANVEQYTTSFNDAAKALGTVSENGDFSVNKLSGYFNESGKKQLETLGLNTEKYLDNLENGTWQLKSDISLEDFYAAIEEAYKNTNKNIDNYYTYIKWAYEAIQKDLQWSQGNYSELPTTLSITELMQRTEGDLADFKNQPDIKNAIEKARGATENLLNDIITKGLDLDLSNYEGLPNEIKDEFGTVTEKNKYQFVRKYASYLGKTIEETNDFLIQVRQSEDESKVAAKEALKDITFYSKDQAYASLDSIKKIADILDVSVDDIIGQYNELLGGYQVNLDNINLSSIDGFAEMVKESIDGIIKNIVGFASSAISGKLSQQDQLNFNAQLKALELSPISNIDFVKTADGLKISQTAATNLYNELKQVDSIQAKLVFDDLNKSLQESNEHYKSISDIANRIKEIEATAPDARSKEYEQELALAKEIYAVRSTTDDSSFSFMSNKIPGAQNNPINYFSNWAKAIHTFNDALKTQGTYTRNGETFESGFVDYDFWYNLVTEMNNIAKVSGTEIEFAGERLNGDLTAASALIEKGAASLVATDTGEIKVALSGMQLDFKTGADAFSGGVTEGIRALAKSQSDMLDGMIQLLETVVAMEELGDIDAGKDGKIDLGDLFPEFTIEGMKQKLKPEILDNFDAFVKEAGDSLNNIIIGTESLASMIDRAKNEGLTQLEAQNFTAIMDSLYSLYKSGEYSLDNIYDSIQSILASSGFEGTIQVGDRQLIIQNGTTIIQTEDGGYEGSDGTKYDTLNDAIIGQQKKVIEKMVKQSDGAITLKENTVTLKIDGKAITLTFDNDGNLTDTNGKSYSSLNAYFKEQIDSDERYDTIEEYKIDKKLKIVPVIEGNGELPPETIAQMKAAGITSAEQLQAIWNEYSSDQKYKFKAKYGVELVGEELTQEQLADINKQLADETKNISINVDDNGTIKAVEDSLKEIKGKTVYIDVVERTSTTKTAPNKTKPGKFTPIAYEPAGGAAGNLGFANAKGTLMGELGPELVVSKGRYFIVGQAGPEMVNLADDAIVFNHLQTESLLKKGISKGRGKAVTNERNAVSFATGNVNGGPAKASASAALAALRQLKAQWDALAGLSAKDLAGKGGGGGGGGGDPKAFLKDLERWYDWLQQIAQLEKEITLEEAKRTEYQSHMVARGKEYFTSQLASLELLQEQAVVQKSLNDSQEEYFQKRLKEINQQSAFSALYGFSESGQLYYKDVYADNKSAFEWLSDLVGRNEVTGEANYTAEEQYNKLVAAGFGFAMEYDSSGNKIKQEGTDWYNTALQAFWDKIDRDKEEMQSLHDSIEDGKKKLLDLENAQNEILHEIEDNQIEVEQKVLKAIEEARQREIDELKDTKEAIENSAKEFTDGLNKQLDKERQMRDNQASADELATLQRRLSILQRSGGSASEIRDLQQQINDKQYDKYFDMQEQQIQAIQDSSDAQIERLDNQIELMEEALAYEKENGLLWTDVDEILKRSSEDIVSFIQGNTSEYWSKSTTELQKVLREDLFEVDRFKQFQATVEDGIEALIMKFGTEEQKKALADKKRAENPVTSTNNSNINTSSAKASGSSGGNNSGKKPQNKKYGFKYTFNGELTTGEQSWDSAEKAKSVALISINEAATRLINSKKYSSIGAVQQMVAQAKKTITAYSTGGYDYTTGLAMLHGTKTRPESIFNAEQTRILREQFLSNRPDSVISLLKDYREAYHGLSTNAYDSIQNNSNATTIEHAEVNLNVDKLANDYDAKRAANTIMDEMLRIASKTSANNSVRR